MLTVNGTNFINSIRFHCKFGDEIVRGAVHSANHATCMVPVLPVGNYSFSVTQNELDYTGEQYWYTVYTDEFMNYIEPVIAIIGNGGNSIITVFGEQFRETPELSCKIGSDVVSGFYVNDSMVYCEANRQSGGAEKNLLVQVSFSFLD